MRTPAAELKAFLSSIAVFGGTSDETLQRLTPLLLEERFDKGATLCRQGEPGLAMYVVLEGEVAVERRTSSGSIVRVMRLGPGEFFGEMTLIDPQPRSAAVVATRPCRILSLENRALAQLYREDVHGYVMIVQNLCRELSRRLRKADARICEIAEEEGDTRTQIGPSPFARRRSP